MFGYIRPLKLELKIRDFELYKAVYCGLCHSMRKKYGLLSRMLINYDVTFFALLRLSLGGECGGFCKKRCIVNLFKKRSCASLTADTAKIADFNVLLCYYKIRDDFDDASYLKKIPLVFLKAAFFRMFKKAEKNSPQTAEILADYAAAQKNVEEKKSASVDEAAHPTGEMTASVLVLGAAGEAEKRVLRRFGYFLGRWIYIMDAADDIQKDIKDGSYNPFAFAFAGDADTVKKARENAAGLLNSCTYEMAACYELLGRKRFDAILSNIVYLGLPSVQKNVLAGKGKKAGIRAF